MRKEKKILYCSQVNFGYMGEVPVSDHKFGHSVKPIHTGVNYRVKGSYNTILISLPKKFSTRIKRNMSSIAAFAVYVLHRPTFFKYPALSVRTFF